MAERRRSAVKAYRNRTFLNSKDARALRILAEYLEPKSRFEQYKIDDTIVFMGSARIPSREQADAALATAQSSGGDLERAREGCRDVGVLRTGARARIPASRNGRRASTRRIGRFVVCTGAGPGIMEAANRGAAEARGTNVGLRISIPIEESDNPYVTRELMFPLPLLLHAQVLVLLPREGSADLPGGFGTLDELFELLTLVQTKRMTKPLPIVLFGTRFWDEVINFDALVKYGTIGRTTCRSCGAPTR
jgi:predicted Rossmann-fold nucleotide-binding protein